MVLRIVIKCFQFLLNYNMFDMLQEVAPKKRLSRTHLLVIASFAKICRGGECCDSAWKVLYIKFIAFSLINQFTEELVD